MLKKLLLVGIMVFGVSSLNAKTKEVIDLEVKAAIQKLDTVVKGAHPFLAKNAKGILVIPNIIKAGIGVGGEYGEGALVKVEDGNMSNIQTVNYYSYASASFGFQLGVEKKTLIYVFLTDEALAQFNQSNGWKGGVGAGVSIAKFGASEDISNLSLNKPVVLFVLGKEGLMYNLTLEGSKLTKIVR